MIRFTALALTVLTGFSGLVYEVAWQRYLAALLGSHGEATAAVLAIFLGGLSLGYALFGRATRWLLARARAQGRRARLLYFYALVEAGIGLYALLFPNLFSLAQYASLAVPVGNEGLRFGFDVMLSALLIGPPAVLMGGTIPILTLALAGSLERATRIHAWVYGFNTVGAFGGALAAGFFVIPRLGLDGTVYAMACINMLAGYGFAQLDRGAEEVSPDFAAPGSGEPLPRFAGWATVALLAGFAMMAIQTTLNRLGALALGASQFTFSMVVAVFVLCIALGSLLVSALPRVPSGLLVASQWMLVVVLVPLYLVLGDITYWAHVVRVLFTPVDQAFYPYYAAVFFCVLGLLIVPIGLSGALLPLLFHQLRREVRDLGAVAGRLYAWNTVGSLLGALIGGYVLFFWLDLHQVFRVAMLAVALGAALLTLLVARSAAWRLTALGVLPALAAIWLLPAWQPDRLAAGLFRNRRPLAVTFDGPDVLYARRHQNILFWDDDPTSSVGVASSLQDAKDRSILVNGKSDGHLVTDYPTMAMSGLVPALMAESHERAFVIGWGTGVTAGELANLEATRHVRVAEISRGVIRAAPHFDAGNLAASQNPKIELVRGDAYRTLLQSRGSYDIIVSEPSNPWVTGVEMLYSREFLEAARARLSPGGVYGQWFHVYETEPDVVELVLRTYAAVFPRVSVWFAQGTDLLLLGFDRPDRALDVRALEERFHRPDFAAAFGRVGIESFPALLAHELLPLGTLQAVELPGEIHTLRHPILSYRAARSFFSGRPAQLPAYVSRAHERVSRRNSLLARLVGGRRPVPEDILQAAARESCRFNRFEQCATLFARWQVDYPDSPRLEENLEEVRRRKNPQELRPRPLAELRALLTLAPARAKGPIPPQQAQRVTNRFLSGYHHAFPFDRQAVEAAWRRCRGEDCDEPRRRAAERLGGLDGGAEPAAPGSAQREPLP